MQLALAAEEPAPRALRATIFGLVLFLLVYSSSAASNPTMASAIIRGGESVGSTAAKGLSLVRRGLRVVITTSTGFWDADRAVEMSDLFSGEPWIIFNRPLELLGWFAMVGLVERLSGLRARAVTAWLRSRASFRTRTPVRPVAPRRRICIFGAWVWWFGEID